ncbi:MAG: hypothetical protein GY759_00435 [Chloroflexi bacterium]|nr:hypothetical protein [Chloroflexota bacterium]
MSTLLADEARMKELFKQAVRETIEEQRDVFYDLFAEVIEDVALAAAIREGAQTEQISREKVFQALGGIS